MFDLQSLTQPVKLFSFYKLTKLNNLNVQKGTNCDTAQKNPLMSTLRKEEKEMYFFAFVFISLAITPHCFFLMIKVEKQ